MNAPCDFLGLQLLVVYPADVGRHVDTGSARWPASVSSSVESSVGVKWIHAACAMQYMCVCVCVLVVEERGGTCIKRGVRWWSRGPDGEIVAAVREFLECSSRQTDSISCRLLEGLPSVSLFNPVIIIMMQQMSYLFTCCDMSLLLSLF